MKKIGLIGGTSWSSTVDYYRIINEVVNERLGGLNFAECIIYSINFNDFQNNNAIHNWDANFQLLYNAAINLKKAGAELILLCANTAHINADKIASEIDLPLIDIRVETAKEIIKKRINKVALLGTVYTMELDFYKSKLAEFNIECLIPNNKQDRGYIEQTLLYELGKGILLPQTKKEYVRIANELIYDGAEGIILGCTEIPLLLSQSDFEVPVFNTTQIHAMSAVEFSLSKN